MAQIRRPKQSYEEHRKEFAAAKGLETRLGEPGGEIGAEIGAAPEHRVGVPAERPPTPAASAGAPAPAAPRQRRATQPEAKLRIKFTVPAPLPGAFDYFDRAVALMGEGKALRLVLARAFDALEADVEAVQRLAGQEFLGDLTLELDAVRSVFHHGFHPSKARPPGQFPSIILSALRGPLQRDGGA